jgi:hypothetical protein
MKNIHIGSIIKQKLDESSMSIKNFADIINCDRTTVYIMVLIWLFSLMKEELEEYLVYH